MCVTRRPTQLERRIALFEYGDVLPFAADFAAGGDGRGRHQTDTWRFRRPCRGRKMLVFGERTYPPAPALRRLASPREHRIARDTFGIRRSPLVYASVAITVDPVAHFVVVWIVSAELERDALACVRNALPIDTRRLRLYV